MRNNFLIAIAMLLLFVTSCKKDTAITPQELSAESENPSQGNSTTINSLDENPELELTVENFFNATYVRDYLDLKHNRIVASDQIVDVMEEINASEYNNGIVSQIGFFYGMPCWSCAEIDPNHNQYSIVPIVSLPDAVITGIIITNHENNPIELELVDRRNLERNFNPENYRHQYLQMVFSFFDNLISKTNTDGQVDSRENVCFLDVPNPNNPLDLVVPFCRCSETGEGCSGGNQNATQQSDCGTCSDNGNNTGGGSSHGGGPIIITLGNYPNWNFGDFGSNSGGAGNGGGGNGGSNYIPDYSWDDLNFTWDDLDLSGFEAANPNDTSFPPVESSGNNTNTLDNVSQYNLFQLEQLYTAQIFNFINTYQLPYQEQDLTDVGLFISCGLAGTNSAEDFFECSQYHLISSVFANLNLTGNENYYIFDHFNPLFNQVVNLIAEEGEAYASDAVKAFISISSVPNTNMGWDDFVDLYNLVVNELQPVLEFGNEDIPFLLTNFEITNQFGELLNTEIQTQTDIDLAKALLASLISTNGNLQEAYQDFMTSELNNYLTENNIPFPTSAAGFTDDFWEILFEILKQVVPELIPGVDTFLELKNSFNSYNNGNYWESTESLAAAIFTVIPIEKLRDLWKVVKGVRKTWKIFKMAKLLRNLGDDLVKGFKKTIFDSNKMSHIFDNVNHNLDAVTNLFGSREGVIAKVYEKLHDGGWAAGIPNAPNNVDIELVLGGLTVTVRCTKVNGVIRIGTMWAP